MRGPNALCEVSQKPTGDAGRVCSRDCGRVYMTRRGMLGRRNYGNHRTTPPACVVPAVRGLAWAAGFLEGEGCFLSSRVHAPQVNREPLERLTRLFGGGIYLTRPKVRRWNECFRWHVSGTRARGVMMTLYALMSARRQAQIRKALTSPTSPSQPGTSA